MAVSSRFHQSIAGADPKIECAASPKRCARAGNSSVSTVVGRPQDTSATGSGVPDKLSGRLVISMRTSRAYIPADDAAHDGGDRESIPEQGLAQKFDDREEMVMSTLEITSAAVVGHHAAGLPSRILAAFAAAARRWYATHTERRLQQAAIHMLRGMSDRELKDIGLSRGQIAFAVTSGTAE